jgi:hypothetical protein
VPIDSHLSYLQKHAFCPPQIATPPELHLGIVVVVPCHDEPEILKPLESLAACEPSACAVEVIVVVSGSVIDDAALKARNLATVVQVQDWAARHATPQLRVHVLHFPDLPTQHAGVGLTRKIGMDEAVHRLQWADNPQGIIVGLDADAVCDAHYLRAIEAYFRAHRKVESCTLAFAFTAATSQETAAIMRIELAERLLVAGLRQAGHPYAYHALGTAMAVRVGAYQAQAGMNKRKAGEDFDFLQKFIELGVHGTCHATVVQAAGRTSRRKPAGIGQRVAQYCAAPAPDYPVFALEGFVALAQGLRGLPSWYRLDAVGIADVVAAFPDGWREFMQKNGFPQLIQELQRYTTSEAAFAKRFFRWFNSLKTFQYFQHCQAHHWENRPLVEVGNALRRWMLGDEAETLYLEALLQWYRAADRS